jgi:hypothetical protein
VFKITKVEGTMIIDEIGKYELTQKWSNRGPRSIVHFPAGAVLEITQVDKSGSKVIGPDFQDWAYWDIPVKKLTKNLTSR